MSNESVKGSSYAYLLNRNMGVGQYDFKEHGRDRSARLPFPETRLSLYLFSPAREWQHVGTYYKESFLEVPLAKVRMSHEQFETAAHRVFDKLGIVVGASVKLEPIQGGAVRVTLPQQVLQEKSEAMDVAYRQAREDAHKQRSNPSPIR